MRASPTPTKTPNPCGSAHAQIYDSGVLAGEVLPRPGHHEAFAALNLSEAAPLAMVTLKQNASTADFDRSLGGLNVSTVDRHDALVELLTSLAATHQVGQGHCMHGAITRVMRGWHSPLLGCEASLPLLHQPLSLLPLPPPAGVVPPQVVLQPTDEASIAFHNYMRDAATAAGAQPPSNGPAAGDSSSGRPQGRRAHAIVVQGDVGDFGLMLALYAGAQLSVNQRLHPGVLSASALTPFLFAANNR